MSANALVNYLRTYGPLATSDSKYDEHVSAEAQRNGVTPIEIYSKVVDRIVANFQQDQPQNVILTGTAGDGKTWHCRKIFYGLGGSEEAWKAGEGRVELALPSGRRLIVIKDLSQFHEDSRQPELFSGLLAAISDPSGADAYLIAANDGQLLRFFRLFRGDVAADSAERTIRTMLEKSVETEPGFHLQLINLSQQSHETLFSEIVSQVNDHPAWSNCGECNVLADGCPIRRNLSVLHDTEMRNRLRDLIRIAAANDAHLPMRHILLLIVNIILGVTNKKQLLDCKTSERLVADKLVHLSNPYDNALGMNLKSADRRSFLAFTVFEGAGVGQETNNAIDGLLLDATPSDLYDAHVANDPVHGAALFEEQRTLYRRGEADDLTAFQYALGQQRRRLFFVLPTLTDESEFDPWRLTVFIHGGSFIQFSDDLRKRKTADKIKTRLVIGLNRSFSGLMCDNGDAVWLTAPAGNTQSRIGRVLDAKLSLGSKRTNVLNFDFDAQGTSEQPQMVIKAWTTAGQLADIVETRPLKPHLFEYLMRVEGGSLSGSFSRQCLEELRQFRLRVIAQLASRQLLETDDIREMRLVRMGDDGRLTDDVIGIAEV